jgi:hypothetical protein
MVSWKVLDATLIDSLREYGSTFVKVEENVLPDRYHTAQTAAVQKCIAIRQIEENHMHNFLLLLNAQCYLIHLSFDPAIDLRNLRTTSSPDRRLSNVN